MKRYRGAWSVGLALGLAGCAGTRQDLAAQGTTGSGPLPALLAWVRGPAPTAAPADIQAKVAPGAGERIRPQPRTAQAEAPATASERLARVFPWLNPGGETVATAT